MTDKYCRECGCKLTKLNWYSSYRKKCDYICKKCQNKRVLEHYKKYKNKYNTKRKKWYQTHKRHTLDKQLQRKYDITMDDYDLMFKQQGGVCLICGKKEKVLCVDHDHKTGKIRGLLCTQCNVGLGCFNVDEQNIQLLISSIEYIRKYNGKV